MGEQVARPKIKRSLNLDVDVYERVKHITERLGVTVNAYLTEAVGQKLLRDESLIKIENNAQNAVSEMMEQMLPMMMALDKENPED